MNGKTACKILIALGLVLLFAFGFMLLGIVIDIQVITKYNYTPISFIFTFLFVGAIIGFLVAFRTVRHRIIVQSVAE